MLRHLRRPTALGPVLIAVLLGLLWTAHLHATGLRMSGDSALFAHTAEVLGASGQWTAPPTRPPLYPALLATLMVVEPFAANAAACLSGLTLTGLLVGLAVGVFQRTEAPWVTVGLVGCAAVWSPIVGVFEVAWTEGTCAVLLLLHVVFVTTDNRSDRWWPLLLAGLTVGLAALTRFVALAAVVAFVAWLLRRRPGRRALAAGALAVGIPGVWLLGSRLLRGSATGSRRPSATGWWDNLLALLDALWQAAASAPLWSALIAVAVVVLAARRIGPRYLLLQLGVQLAAIVAATSIVAVDPIGPRYLAPVMPLVVLLVAEAWPRPRALGPTRSTPLRAAAGLALGLAFVTTAVPTFDAQARLVDPTATRSLPGRGFVASASQRALSSALNHAINGEAVTHIVVVAGRDSAWQWGAPARHRALWKDAGLDPQHLSPVDDHTMHLSARQEGRQVDVYLHRGAPFRDTQRIRRYIERSRGDRDSVFVLAHTGDLRRGPGVEDLRDVVDEDSVVDVVYEASPYLLARVSTSSAPHWTALDAEGPSWVEAVDGSTRFIPQAPPGALACTELVEVDGQVRLSGRWRGAGIARDTVARLLVGAWDGRGKPIPAGPKTAFHRAAVMRGPTAWTAVDAVVDIPGAERMRACIKVVGPGQEGAVEVDLGRFRSAGRVATRIN